MSKKLNELRPFDLEAAKRGEPICWSHLDRNVVFIGAATDGQVAYESGGEVGISRYPEDSFRMKPLCWVEDRPVYKGDVLWNKECPEYRYDVDCMNESGDTVLTMPNETDSRCEYPDKLTWTKPYLCLVEGRPVYKGDELYLNWSKGPSKVRAVAMDDDLLTIRHLESQYEDYGLCSEDIDDLTWVAPARKVKKEGWIAVKTGEKPESYASCCSHVCKTKEQAEAHYGDQPACCVRIEWEEEA